MTRLIGCAVLIAALAGCASTSGWRALRIDGHDQESFEASVAEFQQALSAPRRELFEVSLAAVWVDGARAAEADGNTYTPEQYFSALDELSYDRVVDLAADSELIAQYRSASAPDRARTAPWRGISGGGGFPNPTAYGITAGGGCAGCTAQ